MILRLHGNKEDIVDVVGVVGKAIPSKSNIPIIQGVLVEVLDGKLVLTANNLEMGIMGVLEGLDVEGECRVVLPRRFVEVLRNLPSNEVTISLEDNNIVVKSGKSRFTFRPMPADEFPVIAEDLDRSNWSGFELSAGDLKEIINLTSFAASKESTRPAFTGILIESNEGERLICTASDGYRLARMEKEVDVGSGFRLLAPCKNMIDLAKVLDDNEENVRCFYKHGEIMFFYKNYTLSSSLLQDDYPDLSRVFPTEPQTRVVADRDILSGILSRAMLAVSDGTPRMNIDVGDGLLNISVVEELGTFEETADIDHEGESLEGAMFNIRYLTDPLGAWTGSLVNVSFSGQEGPCVFMSAGEGELYRYLVLPIKS